MTLLLQPETTLDEETAMAYTLPLDHPEATLDNVGGKGASLARLMQAGMPVPAGFHVTTAAYRRFVQDNALQPVIAEALQSVNVAQPDTLETASNIIRLKFLQGRMSAEIAAAIAQSYAALGEDCAVAVRSSATAEDLPDLSFAGQQDSFLNVRGIATVQETVKQCWASLWTARAIGYRTQHNIDHNAVSLAVVVQQLVNAKAAGVLFTANPINGRRDQAVINAAWGLGEAIVGGLVTPDTIVVETASGKVIDRQTANKLVMVVRSTRGTIEQAVPDRLRLAAVLSDQQAVRLVQLGVQIDELYGLPMDIEWVLLPSPVGRGAGDQGEFAIVQARPITALPEPPLEWPRPHPKVVMARGSFAEFVPEPVTPLFATLAVPMAREATVKLMNEVGVSGSDSYLFAVINDYVYVGIKFTPKKAWQFLKASILMYPKMLKSSQARAVAAREQYLATAHQWQARELTALSPTELLGGARQIFSMTAEYYTVAQSGTIPLSMTSEAVFAGFYNALIKRRGDPDAATFVFGSENQAVRAEKSLFDLAAWAKEQPGLAEALLKKPADEISRALTATADGAPWDEFCSRLRAHLAQFGHAIFDLDFAKPVPADDPTPLVETLKTYLNGGGNPYERQRAALDRRKQAAEAVAKRLDPLRRKYFLKLLKWAQDTAPLREDSIADLGLGYPQLRKVLGELGRRLAAQGAIADAEDVYWLEVQEADELAAALEQGKPLADHSGTIAGRKAQWQAMRRISPPNTLPHKIWMSRFYPSEGQTGNTLKGFGASTGKVAAPACVMLGPEDFGKLRPGDVIVAGITTPAWTPLFARASAIVTDIGGPLSHSSIVAREYGIPAVLGTGVATKRIHTGQTITVDGSAGTVTLTA